MSWITGFFADWNGQPVGSVPYAKYTHLIHFAAEPGPNGTVNAAAINTSIASTFTGNAHAAGTKAIYSITSNGSNFPPNASSGTRATFISNMISFMNTYGYDGIDLDWESNINIADYAALITQLRSALPAGKLLTISAYGGGGGTPLDAVLAAGASHLDQVNMMTYDMDLFGASDSWFNTAIHSGPNGEASIQAAFTDFRTRGGGIPASKIGIGIPFYGRHYNGVNGPVQSGASRQGSTFYRDLVAQGRVPSGAEQYNSTYGGAYLTYSGEFWPYTSTHQIDQIVAYGQSVGVGGFMVFSVEQEWISGASGDARYPLSTALLAATGGSTPSVPTIYSFTADQATISSGGGTTLRWSIADATTISIDNGLGTQSGTSVSVTALTVTTTYVITATNAQGSATQSVTVTVASGDPVINSFTATPANFISGTSVTLAWDTILATTLSIDQGIGTVTGTSLVVNPGTTKTYRLTATNSSTSVIRDVTVTAGSPDAFGAPALPVIQSFTASATTVTQGTPVTLSFSVVGATTRGVSISPNVGTFLGNSVSFTPFTTGTYTLTASNGVGAVSQSIQIVVHGSVGENIRVHQIRRDERHGDSQILQASDGTGIVGHIAQYDLDGSLTDGGIAISSVGSGTPIGTSIREIPAGTLNSSNVAFTLSHTPLGATLTLYLNGVEQVPDVDFTIAGTAITMSVAPKARDTGYWIAEYSF